MRYLNALIFCVLTTAVLNGQDLNLASSLSSPAPIGEKVTWTAESNSETTWYRFRVKQPDGNYRVIRDFGPVNTLDWTVADWEGVYEMEVTARDLESGESTVVSKEFVFQPRAVDGPVINTTRHPLTLLYSSPPCPDGWEMSVEHTSPDGMTYRTPFRHCRDGLTMNFYVAGLLSDTDYAIRHKLRSIEDPGNTVDGPEVNAHIAPLQRRPKNMGTMAWNPKYSESGVVAYSILDGTMVVTDLHGRVVWFYEEWLAAFTRANGGGTFWGLIQDGGRDQSYQVVREFDVAGYTVTETNAARVNEQLREMGMAPICSFHHEAFRLEDGKIVLLASSERLMTDVQGPGEQNVLGDTIVVLDSNLNVVWAWDAFDHLDARRVALDGTQCSPWGAGCPPFYLADRANDWTHANAIRPTKDGNLLLSVRHQDWVIKIDYAGGEGSGRVIWKLGREGDFVYDSDNIYPWFSHQHDASELPEEPNFILLFDNGNLRCDGDPVCHSRGQVIALDEETKKARLVLNVDLMEYSFALGSAQQLPDGDYAFNNGILPDRSAISILFDKEGMPLQAITNERPVYRSIWMRDLFTVW